MIELDIYSVHNPNARKQLEKDRVTQCIGKGTYAVGRNFLHVTSYELRARTDPKATLQRVRQVKLRIGEGQQSVVRLSRKGIGRLQIPLDHSPNQWLIIRDNALSKKQDLA